MSTKLQEGIVTCRKCRKKVIWMSSKNGVGVLVDADTYHNEFLYDPSIHRCHWKSCSSYAVSFQDKKNYSPQSL
jgi:hypothetical protein